MTVGPTGGIMLPLQPEAAGVTGRQSRLPKAVGKKQFKRQLFTEVESHPLGFRL